MQFSDCNEDQARGLLSRSRFRNKPRLFQPGWPLPRYQLGFGLSDPWLFKRDGTLQNHLNRSSCRIVDLVAPSKQNLGKSCNPADATANQGSLSPSRERPDDGTFSVRSGNSASILALTAIRLNAAFLVDYPAIVSSGNIVYRTGNRNCVAARKDQGCEMK